MADGTGQTIDHCRTMLRAVGVSVSMVMGMAVVVRMGMVVIMGMLMFVIVRMVVFVVKMIHKGYLFVLPDALSYISV